MVTSKTFVMRILIGLCIQMVAVTALTLSVDSKNASNLLMGGDLDAHGCKHSAGYVWCNATNSCVPASASLTLKC